MHCFSIPQGAQVQDKSIEIISFYYHFDKINTYILYHFFILMKKRKNGRREKHKKHENWTLSANVLVELIIPKMYARKSVEKPEEEEQNAVPLDEQKKWQKTEVGMWWKNNNVEWLDQWKNQ